jgi:DNA-binding HxlR family transcriptional regulator
MASIRLAGARRGNTRVRETLGDDPHDHAGRLSEESVHLNFALDVLRRRWRADVVWCLRGGALRFNAILAALTPVSHKVLTEQLRALERAGVVARELGPGGGRHVEYHLTPLGAELPPILDRLRAWGVAHECTRRERSARAMRLHDVTEPSRANTA